MRRLKISFETVDVFSDRQFGGNPVAVVYGAEQLTSTLMQKVATEFNLAETAFVLPPQRETNTARVRIFTPAAEIPFAGHPNLGTAFSIANRGELFGKRIFDTMVFEQIAGDVRLKLSIEDGKIEGAELEAPQPFQRAQDIPVESIAACCGIKVTDIQLANHAPTVVSCGMKFIVCELNSRIALAACAANIDGFNQFVSAATATGVYVYTKGRGSEYDVEARMFAPLYGVPEDPATGSAAIALGCLLTELDANQTTEKTMIFSQGVDMGRPGLIRVRVRKTKASVEAAFISGDCTSMMNGTLNIHV